MDNQFRRPVDGFECGQFEHYYAIYFVWFESMFPCNWITLPSHPHNFDCAWNFVVIFSLSRLSQANAKDSVIVNGTTFLSYLFERQTTKRTTFSFIQIHKRHVPRIIFKTVLYPIPMQLYGYMCMRNCFVWKSRTVELFCHEKSCQ